jgi:hypothetical protein
MKGEDGYLPAFFRENCSINLPGIYKSVEFTQTQKRNAEVLVPPNWCSFATEKL